MSKKEMKKKLSRKVLCIIIGVIVAAVVVGGVLIWRNMQRNGHKQQTSAEKVEEQKDTSASDKDSNKETEDTQNNKGDADQKDAENLQSVQSEQKNSGSVSGSSDVNADDSEKNTEQQTSGSAVSLPYTIPDSNLEIRNIASYDGIFIEDGSDEKVKGITMIVLKNTGDTDIEYAAISMKRDGSSLQFTVSDLPAGATVAVQEKNKTSYKKSGVYTDCQAQVAEIDGFDKAEKYVKVEETDDKSLKVTNLTNKDIPAVRIFYKFYIKDEKAYVGGITYTAKVEDLKAKESREIQPAHYVSGSSKVMMVRTYESE